MPEHPDLTFRKSSYSANEAACVEIAEGRSVMVRDTQNRDLGALGFAGAEWAAALLAITE